MINIRKGMFETNSSSVHSYVFYHDDENDKNLVYNIPKDALTENGTLVLRLANFGGETNIVSSVTDKLSWFISSAIDYDEEPFLMFLSINKEEADDDDIKLLTKLVSSIDRDGLDDEFEKKAKEGEFYNEECGCDVFSKVAVKWLERNNTDVKELFETLRDKCGIKNIEIALNADDEWYFDPFGGTEGDTIEIEDIFNTNFVISTGNDNGDWPYKENVSKDDELFEMLRKDNNYKAPVKVEYMENSDW